MSRRAQLIVRNASFQGPAGSQGQQGATGPTGPAGVVAAGMNTADSATLTNITAFTAFAANVQYSEPANTLAVGTVLRHRWWGQLTTGAAQQVALQAFLGTVGMQNPNFTVPTAIATYHFEIDLETIIRTTGAGGTCTQVLRARFLQDATSTAQAYTVTQDHALDTTAAQNANLSLASTVANNTAKVLGFYRERLN